MIEGSFQRKTRFFNFLKQIYSNICKLKKYKILKLSEPKKLFSFVQKKNIEIIF